MSPTGSGKLTFRKKNTKSVKKGFGFLSDYLVFLKKLLTWENVLIFVFNPQNCLPAMVLLLLAEVFVNIAVILLVPYTEIDWIAYMQEVEGVLNGTWDYSQLKGDTGPLVYPAGFVYIFTVFYWITNSGANIKLAQWMFAVLYIVFVATVFFIYMRHKRVPPWTYAFMCCTSYRIHSIFILRLFNDPIAMLLCYISVVLFLRHQWKLGCVFYSLAVSVKMNILMFSPGLLWLLLLSQGMGGTVICLLICALTQLVLGLPFILENPVAYMSGAFNLGRQFMYKWTVNFRFIPEEAFLDRRLHITLLCLHIGVLALFFFRCWLKMKKGPVFSMKPSRIDLSAHEIVLPLFTANFVGMCFCRSLHYQFYVWYFHTLPYLLWSTELSSPVRLLLLGVIELCWNTYPSTILSSAALHCSHLVMLAALFWEQSKPTHIKSD